MSYCMVSLVNVIFVVQVMNKECLCGNFAAKILDGRLSDASFLVRSEGTKRRRRRRRRRSVI